MIDLVNDCRELARVLVGAGSNRTGVGRATGLPAVPGARVGGRVGAMVGVTEVLSVTVVGYEDYGS